LPSARFLFAFSLAAALRPDDHLAAHLGHHRVDLALAHPGLGVDEGVPYPAR
jgi:hypothetical protein